MPDFHQGGQFHPSHPRDGSESAGIPRILYTDSTILFPDSGIQRVSIPLPAAIPAIPRERIPTPPPSPQNSQFFQIIFPFPSASAKGRAGAAVRFPPSSLFRGKPRSCRSQESSGLSLRGWNLGHRASLSRGSGIQGLGFTLD